MNKVTLSKRGNVVFEGSLDQFFQRIKPVEVASKKPDKDNTPHHIPPKSWEDNVIDRTIPLLRTAIVSQKKRIPVRKPKKEKKGRWQ